MPASTQTHSEVGINIILCTINRIVVLAEHLLLYAPCSKQFNNEVNAFFLSVMCLKLSGQQISQQKIINMYELLSYNHE